MLTWTTSRRAILAAAEHQLREAGYAGMSLESVAAAAGTTVPAVRRRFGGKAGLAVAVIDSLRVDRLPAESGPPRRRALAVLRNFRANLLSGNSMAVVGTLLAEERRHPELLAAFRRRLAEPRRAALRRALAEGISAGELPALAPSAPALTCAPPGQPLPGPSPESVIHLRFCG
jgi:AcrR family transcriptional regulator